MYYDELFRTQDPVIHIPNDAFNEKNKKKFWNAALTCQLLMIQGYLLLRMGEELKSQVLMNFDFLDLTKQTTGGMIVTEKKMKEHMWGVSRRSIPEDSIGNILSRSNRIVGDVTSEDLIVKTNRRPSVLQTLGEMGLFTERFFGEEVNGITCPTWQVNGGKNRLPLHIEHWGAYSANILHAGEPKWWQFVPSENYYPVIDRLTTHQMTVKNWNHYRGMCERTYNHRQGYWDLQKMGIECVRVVKQMPGDIILVDNFTAHSVYNAGKNMAESINYMPLNGMKIASAYKVCQHSEDLCSRPKCQEVYAKMDRELKKNKISVSDMIHPSDPKKDETLAAFQQLQVQGKFVNIAKDYIKYSAVFPEDFLSQADNVPFTGSENKKRKHESEPSRRPDYNYLDFQKVFCNVCGWQTNWPDDYVNHMKNKHGMKVDKPEFECPKCHRSKKSLRHHVGLNICYKRRMV